MISVNVDDDDNDGGSGAHGQTRIVSDMYDLNGVEGENDMIRLHIHGVQQTGVEGFFKLEYPRDKLRIWMNPNKTDLVVSGSTTFGARVDSYPYVECLTSGDAIVKLLLYQKSQDGHAYLCQARGNPSGEGGSSSARVTFHGAEPMFAIFEDSGSQGANFIKAALGVRSVDPGPNIRTAPYFITVDNSHYYSVYLWSTEKQAKLALQTKDAYVVVEGHGNPAGFQFVADSEIRNFTDFMNVGEKLIGINRNAWRNMYPNLGISPSDYGDDRTTATIYDPFFYEDIVVGNLAESKKITRFADHPIVNIPSGLRSGHMTLRDTQNEHYNMWGSFPLPQLVVRSGWGADDAKPPDMPVQRWKKLLINCCDSWKYYYYQFQHPGGTQFFTWDTCMSDQTDTEFLMAIAAQKDDAQIAAALNDREEYYSHKRPYDWKSF